MSPIVAAAKQAEQLKQDGNNYFQKNRFGAAIEAYTEAITLCPNVPIYWTNRALCHRKRNEWTRVEEDCTRAIQLDHNSVKAHYMLGLALLQREQYAEGVRELEKALDLGRGANPRSYMVEEIWQELAKAKYLEWEHESSRRSLDLKNLKEACDSALKEKHELDSSQMEGFIDDRATSLLKQLDALGRVFRKAAEDDTPAEVPDYLCCKITLDIFRDPVITPSGVTYERAVILDHLQKKIVGIKQHTLQGMCRPRLSAVNSSYGETYFLTCFCLLIAIYSSSVKKKGRNVFGARESRVKL